MGPLFGSKPESPPPVPPPPPVPTIDDAKLRAEAADAANRKRGRRASVLAGAEGVEEPTKKKTLIGS